MKKYLILGLFVLLALPTLAVTSSVLLMTRADAQSIPPKIEGIFWQVDQISHPSGNWHLLGIDTFVTQWSIVDGHSFFKEIPTQQWEHQPKWNSIAEQPWAKKVILGLAGNYQEPIARENIDQLFLQSQQVIHTKLPVQPAGYYFPVEADPSWHGIANLAHHVSEFKRPVWISIYSADRKSPFLHYWLESWLPDNAQVFFQDGVGVGTRSPEEAALIYKNLKNEFGENRVVIILEAFRPKPDGSFRAAYPWEIAKQLRAYAGQRIYIFDGPHYLDKASVFWLYLWMKINY